MFAYLGTFRMVIVLTSLKTNKDGNLDHSSDEFANFVAKFMDYNTKSSQDCISIKRMIEGNIKLSKEINVRCYQDDPYEEVQTEEKDLNEPSKSQLKKMKK